MAWKSPHEVRGVRWLVRMIFQMSSTYSPERMIFTGGSRRPSW